MLTEVPLPRLQGETDTNKNIIYPPPLYLQLPSTTVKNRFTASEANIVHEILKQ